MSVVAPMTQLVELPIACLPIDASLRPICTSPFLVTSGQELLSRDSALAASWPRYTSDLLEMLTMLPSEYMSRRFLIRFGDCIDPAPHPLLSKARRPGDANAILLPVNYDRHFGPTFHSLVAGNDVSLRDFPFEDKIPKVIWRGSTTGHEWDPSRSALSNPRRALVERWTYTNDSRVDVGLSELVQELLEAYPRSREHWQRFVKPFTPVNRQLLYRYLVAVEGNDVASSLKWMLASNSVVLMPPPSMETWAGESKLQPWLHYVPLRPDLADLAQKVEWCEANLGACLRISREASAYMRAFDDQQATFRRGAEILRGYLDSVHVQWAYR